MASDGPAYQVEVLRVRDWDALYENNRTRGLQEMRWVPVPNKLDGDGYTELVDHENGAAHLGCWLTILQVASKCHPRGVLLRDSGPPHTSTSLARLTRIPSTLFDVVIPRLKKIGWLEVIEQQGAVTLQAPAGIPQATAGIPQAGAGSTRPTDYGMEWKGMEGNGNTLCSSSDERGDGDLELIPQQTKPVDAIKDWFESELWPAYPRKVAKPQGLKAARRFGKTAADRTSIMECLLRKLPALQAQFKADGDYRPYLSSWLGQQPWNDVEETDQPAVPKIGGGGSSAIDEAMKLYESKASI